MCQGIKTKGVHKDSCIRPLLVQSAGVLGLGRYDEREMVAPGAGGGTPRWAKGCAAQVRLRNAWFGGVGLCTAVSVEGQPVLCELRD